MEREKELLKLVNVLRQTSRTAFQAQWTGADADAAARCVKQYNSVLARLTELDSSVGTVFQSLEADSSLSAVALASRQLAAYYADEVGSGWPGFGWPGGWPCGPRGPFDPKAFKEFWRTSAGEIEDFGEFVRENLSTWFSDARCRSESEKADGDGESDPAGKAPDVEASDPEGRVPDGEEDDSEGRAADGEEA